VVPAQEHAVTRLIYAQGRRGIGRYIRMLLRFKGTDVPRGTLRGDDVHFPHCATAVTICGKTIIHPGVVIFPNVTVGRVNIFEPVESEYVGAELRPMSVLCAGAVVLPGAGPLVVGEGTVIGANAVLTQSTGDWEIWAGAPARKIGVRTRPAPGVVLTFRS
jgi:serine O-acetyltransferase